MSKFDSRAGDVAAVVALKSKNVWWAEIAATLKLSSGVEWGIDKAACR